MYRHMYLGLYLYTDIASELGNILFSLSFPQMFLKQFMWVYIECKANTSILPIYTAPPYLQNALKYVHMILVC